MNCYKRHFVTYWRFFHVFIVPESLKNARLVLQENSFLQNEYIKETGILPQEQIDLYKRVFKKTMLLPSQIRGGGVRLIHG